MSKGQITKPDVRSSEITQAWAINTKYNFPRYKKLLKAHFANGGGLSHIIIAGVLGVAPSTVDYWLNPNHRLYRGELDHLIAILKAKSIMWLDRLHRDAASGKNGDANSTILKQRASSHLGMHERIESHIESNLTHNVKNLEQLDNEIEQLSEEINHLSGIARTDT